LSPLQDLMDGQGQPQQPQEYQLPPELQNAQAWPTSRKPRPSTQHKQAQAFKTHQEAALQAAGNALDFVSAEGNAADARGAPR
jgi:hypothetical protein